MAVKGFGVLWVDNDDRKPTEFAWYLLAIAGNQILLPMVGIGLWNSVYRKWEHVTYPGIAAKPIDALKIRYWAKMVELPPELKAIRDREMGRFAVS